MNEDLFKQMNKDLNTQNNCDDSITADVVVEKASSDSSFSSSKEELEQISKSVAVGRMEVEYEDDRNVIHAIINAISVRINMRLAETMQKRVRQLIKKGLQILGTMS